MTLVREHRTDYQRSKKNDSDVSKFMSWALRHKPEEAGIKLDPFGWVAMYDLRDAIMNRFNVYFHYEDLFHIVNTSDKKRFEVNISASVIRAAQGHSVDVDLQLAPMVPTHYLYHGTTVAVLEAIQTYGIQKRDRHHVHLSEDTGVAINVATRRKGPHAIITIDTDRMVKDGIQFFMTSNRVWLTDHIDPAYIHDIDYLNGTEN